MAAPLLLPAIMGGASLLGSVFKTVGERKRQKDAERALAKMKYQELQNVADDLGVSTLGAESRQRELSRGFATGTEALRSAGVRGVVGGTADLLSSYDEATSDITADLDMQRKQIDRLKALDAQRIREIEESRTLAEIQGLSSEMQAGREGKGAGLTSLFSSAGMLTAALFGEEAKDGEA